MKRIHIHVSVSDLERSTQYYRQLFDLAPSVVEDDYRKWALSDPPLNFAISNRTSKPGVDHLGIEVSSENALEALKERVAGRDQSDAHCCYARSEKKWAADPDGVPWELFFTSEQAETFGADLRDPLPKSGACCG